jgi:DNA processing protein
MYTILSITAADYVYPALLKEIHNPPPVVYIAGDAKTLHTPAIAIVGSRAMTSYGEQVCRRLVRDLVQAGFTIVSGLATGIDGTAHREALAAGGKTIAVLGSGLDPESVYPAEHRSLAKTIANGHGVLVSEYASGTRSQRYCFPARNRIIAGLTLGTVVIEARQKSGALITAKYALEYNREVFAVPGSIVSSRSAGTHQLLRQGATLVESVADIINELQQSAGFQTSIQALLPLSPKPVYTAQQQTILELLEAHAYHPDAITSILNTTTGEILMNLTELEIKGIVRKNIDYTYSLVRQIH